MRRGDQFKVIQFVVYMGKLDDLISYVYSYMMSSTFPIIIQWNLITSNQSETKKNLSFRESTVYYIIKNV